jgi:3-isopropylmalate/(R)-2-methylmalate dehydratase small subunit
VKALREVTGKVAVLDRGDVDTDQIIPKQFLKRIERTGFGEFLFFDWRKDPGFELNRPEAQGARILIAGRNFGCGSSREHAAWALQQAGYDVVIAPSFGDIFRQNALKIGLIPIATDEAAELMGYSGQTIEIDLEAQEIRGPGGYVVRFEIGEFERNCILEGLDEIGLSLKHEDAIAAFEARHSAPFDATALPA